MLDALASQVFGRVTEAPDVADHTELSAEEQDIAESLLDLGVLIDS